MYDLYEEPTILEAIYFSGSFVFMDRWKESSKILNFSVVN